MFQQTKAAIKVFSQCCPLSTERVCAIQGTPAIVIDAIKAILDIIFSTQIKGTIKLYDPYNYDIYSVNEYGGFTDPGTPNAYRNANRNYLGPPEISNKGGGMELNDVWDRNTRHGHFHSAQILTPQTKSWSRMNTLTYNPSPVVGERRDLTSATTSHSYQRWILPRTDHFRHSAQSYHHADPNSAMMSAGDRAPYWSDVIPGQEKLFGHNSQMTHQMSQGWAPNSYTKKSNMISSDCNIMINLDGTSQTSLLVPNSVAGAIIGQGGCRIRNVRRDSGADVSIENGTLPGKKRVITIKGTAPQVRIAYEMLQRR